MVKVDHNKKKRGLLVIAVMSVVIAGIILPGTIFKLQEKQEYNVVKTVDEKYLTSSSVISRNASKSLTNMERMQLITGEWESQESEVKRYEMEQDDYEIVELARKNMNILYKLGIYPVDLAEKYGNWYSWTAVPYKAEDTTFHTYTAYYWVIYFQKYDKTESHTIKILEDGTIFHAEANLNTNVDINNIKDAGLLQSAEEEITVTPIECETEAIEDWISYKDVDIENMSWKALTKVTKEDSEFHILQLYGDKKYLYIVVP